MSALNPEYSQVAVLLTGSDRLLVYGCFRQSGIASSQPPADNSYNYIV